MRLSWWDMVWCLGMIAVIHGVAQLSAAAAWIVGGGVVAVLGVFGSLRSDATDRGRSGQGG